MKNLNPENCCSSYITPYNFHVDDQYIDEPKKFSISHKKSAPV